MSKKRQLLEAVQEQINKNISMMVEAGYGPMVVTEVQRQGNIIMATIEKFDFEHEKPKLGIDVLSEL